MYSGGCIDVCRMPAGGVSGGAVAVPILHSVVGRSAGGSIIPMLSPGGVCGS